MLIIHIRGLLTPLVTALEPPSRAAKDSAHESVRDSTDDVFRI